MDLESLETAVEKSLQYYKRAGGKGPVRMEDTWVSVKDLQDSLIALREILRCGEMAEVKRDAIRETFDVYQSTGSDGEIPSVYRLFRVDHEGSERGRRIQISCLQCLPTR
jgi:hypothetical protein